jgi:hypothetical protein
VRKVVLQFPQPGVSICNISSEFDGKQHYYVTPLSPEFVYRYGLRSEAIMGELANGPEDLSQEHFTPNPLFLRFVGWVIAKHAANCSELVDEAKRTKNGLVFILDARTPSPDGAVPPEDIIGGVTVQNGELLEFNNSPNYQLLTQRGFMELDPWFRDRLVEELTALIKTD